VTLRTQKYAELRVDPKPEDLKIKRDANGRRE